MSKNAIKRNINIDYPIKSSQVPITGRPCLTESPQIVTPQIIPEIMNDKSINQVFQAGFMLAALMPTALVAQALFTGDAASDQNFSTAGNWDGGAVPTGDNIAISANGTSSAAPAVVDSGFGVVDLGSASIHSQGGGRNRHGLCRSGFRRDAEDELCSSRKPCEQFLRRYNDCAIRRNSC
jgi:hypothetical protein